VRTERRPLDPMPDDARLHHRTARPAARPPRRREARCPPTAERGPNATG
jgi:hypothetical protein